MKRREILQALGVSALATTLPRAGRADAPLRIGVGRSVRSAVPNSAVALGIQQLAREEKRICLFTGAGTTELSGKSCSPYGFQWAFDTYTLAACSTEALISQGDKTWFFVTVD